MAERRRANLRGILANPDLRRELMVPVIQAIQAREGIETTREQAELAYYVVTEAEKATFFDLGRDNAQRRHATFVAALRGEISDVRFDVARRDFGTIEGSPLAYRRVGLVGHVFRENVALDPYHARARRGAYTGDDPRYVRFWWEIPSSRATPTGFSWERFAKGGDFSRFYADVDLVVHWDPVRRTFAEFHGRKGRETERPESLDDFFKPGLTWPLAASAFNVRWLPPGCVFGHKGPAVFPSAEEDTGYLAGIINSQLAEYILLGLTSREAMGGRWEVGVVKRLPIPKGRPEQRLRVGTVARTIHDAKALMDEGNETSTRFRTPWLLGAETAVPARPIATRLNHLAEHEQAGNARIQKVYAELNDEVYRLYGIPDTTRKTIEATLGERPPEILWPRMEGKSVEQKRMEHVWRLLSYAVKRVLEADDDGIVSFNAVNGEPRLLDRVRQELAGFFPGRDVNQVEVEIVNELKRTVKGYRKCQSLDEWLDNVFFEYHCGLYKSRPIFWHIASAQGTSPFAFGALVHYHRFDKNRMAKFRASYLRDAIEEFRREAGLADKAGRPDDRLEWQAKVEEAQALDQKLRWIQEGHHDGPEGGDHDYRILTPWKSLSERPQGWDPDLDDGVKVNIEPFEKADVLRTGVLK